MENFKYTIRDPNGIHARPAGLIVTEAKKYKSSVTAECKGKSADCKRLFSVMSLGASSGDTLLVTATGCDEKEAALGIMRAMTEAKL